MDTLKGVSEKLMNGNRQNIEKLIERWVSTFNADESSLSESCKKTMLIAKLITEPYFQKAPEDQMKGFLVKLIPSAGKDNKDVLLRVFYNLEPEPRRLLGKEGYLEHNEIQYSLRLDELIYSEDIMSAGIKILNDGTSFGCKVRLTVSLFEVSHIDEPAKDPIWQVYDPYLDVERGKEIGLYGGTGDFYHTLPTQTREVIHCIFLNPALKQEILELKKDIAIASENSISEFRKRFG